MHINGFILGNEFHYVLLGMGDDVHSLKDCH